jgi:hypothetical protein
VVRSEPAVATMRPALAYELDAYIAAALKQYSLHRVLDAIA